jgi:hypothetical protein
MKQEEGNANAAAALRRSDSRFHNYWFKMTMIVIEQSLKYLSQFRA